MALLSKDDLGQTLAFTNKCLTCVTEEEFNTILLSFSAFLGFNFVLYAYTKESYPGDHAVQLVNLSNPKEWAAEYDQKEYLIHDPIRHELERIMASGSRSAFISWDDYTWELSPIQQQVIERRNYYGLYYGFSFFIDSESKDFMFLFSFSSSTTIVTSKAKILCQLLGPHLMQALKRVTILEQIATLSEKEKVTAMLITEGKTNCEIAETLDITIHTVKYHIKNIFQKLQATNRQQAIAVLLAARYLGT